MMNVGPGRLDILRRLRQPPRTRPLFRQRPIYGFEELDEVALDPDGAEHVRLAEIELGIPQPAEQRASIADVNRPDRSCRRPQLEPVPEDEPNRGGADVLLNALERPAIEQRGRVRRRLVRQRGNGQRRREIAAHSVRSTWIVQSLRSATMAPIAANTGARSAPTTPAVRGNSATVRPSC